MLISLIKQDIKEYNGTKEAFRNCNLEINMFDKTKRY